MRLKSLRAANLIFAALLLMQALDQSMNQPERALPDLGPVIGALMFAGAGASCLLAFKRSNLAPAVATIVGLGSLGLGLLTHVFPRWSDLVSDPYRGAGVNFVSWLVLLAMLGAAAWLGYRGWRVRYAPSDATPLGPALALASDDSDRLQYAHVRADAPGRARQDPERRQRPGRA